MKTMSKRTAVDWIIESLVPTSNLPIWSINEFISKAKEMEEEQIVDAFYAGTEAEGLESGEDYYVKNYGE